MHFNCPVDSAGFNDLAASLQAPKLFVIANDLSQMQVETSIDSRKVQHEADIERLNHYGFGAFHPRQTRYLL